MAKATVQVGFRWKPEVRAALEKAAEEDRRSLSGLSEVVVTAWLKDKGYLPQKDAAA